MNLFRAIAPDASERSDPRPGDDIVATPDAVMDRAFDLPGPPAQVWPWIVQLGKARAGWYLSRRVERLIPRSRRAARSVDPRWQSLAVGDLIPDYGGKDETFEVVTIAPPSTLVYRSTRGRASVSWAITLRPEGASGTRIQFRLRVGPLKHPWLVHTGGEAIDLLTIAGLANGLRERLADRATVY